MISSPACGSGFCQAIADPNIALLLLILGALGIYAEFSSPGLVLPGVLGAIAVLLGLTALAMFPIGWLGAALVILGLTFFVLEAKFATHGILTAGGAIALLLGALLLIDTPDPALRIRFSMALGGNAPVCADHQFPAFRCRTRAPEQGGNRHGCAAGNSGRGGG